MTVENVNAQIELMLEEVNSKRAIYAVKIEGSNAKATFEVSSEYFINIFEQEHFSYGVHRCVQNLKNLDPQYHQDEVKALF